MVKISCRIAIVNIQYSTNNKIFALDMLLTLKKYWLIYGFTNTFQIFNFVALESTFTLMVLLDILRRKKQKTAASSLRLL